MIAGTQREHVLSICVEVCSAAMYLDNEPGVLISACPSAMARGRRCCPGLDRPGAAACDGATPSR